MSKSLFSADFLRIVNRWRLRIEDYDLTSDLMDSDALGVRRSFAVYGEIPVVGRVVLAVITTDGKTRYVDEVIDNYLVDVDPKLAVELTRDVDFLMANLSVDLCRDLRRSAIELE